MSGTQARFPPGGLVLSYLKLLVLGGLLYCGGYLPWDLPPFVQFNPWFLLPLLLLPPLLRGRRLPAWGAFLLVALLSHPFDTFGRLLLSDLHPDQLYRAYYDAFVYAANHEVQATREAIAGLVALQRDSERLWLILYHLGPACHAILAWIFLLPESRGQARA